MSDRSTLPSQFPAKVRAKACDTCIFGPNTPISAKRFAELKRKWSKSGHQICHKHGSGDAEGSEGEDVWCAGFFATLPRDVRESFVALGFVRLVSDRDEIMCENG